VLFRILDIFFNESFFNLKNVKRKKHKSIKTRAKKKRKKVYYIYKISYLQMRLKREDF